MKQNLSLAVGGWSREKVFAQLRRHSIQLNPYAEELLNHPSFPYSPKSRILALQILDVKELGFEQGATLPQIIHRIESCSLSLCPAETAIYLRLFLLQQTPSLDPVLSGRHQAPQGAITVASLPFSDDLSLPRGFYLRNLNGQLWLRAYHCDDTYLWKADDVFAFLVSP